MESYRLGQCVREAVNALLMAEIRRSALLRQAYADSEALEQLAVDGAVAWQSFYGHLSALERLAARDIELTADRDLHGPTDCAGRARVAP